MTKVIAILISAIFFFGLGDEFPLAVKKTTILKIHKGLPSLGNFTTKLTNENID